MTKCRSRECRIFLIQAARQGGKGGVASRRWSSRCAGEGRVAQNDSFRTLDASAAATNEHKQCARRAATGSRWVHFVFFLAAFYVCVFSPSSLSYALFCF